ncbi:MAG: permease prefix domain 1-containing protein [Thermoleophilia bacterium]
MPELIERYLAELERRLPGRRRLRRRVVAEASRHLHEAFAEEHAAGVDERAAEQRAIERFGPASDVADGFRTVLPVRYVTTRRVVALVTAGLVAALIATVVQETSTPDTTTPPRAQAASPRPPLPSSPGATAGSPAAPIRTAAPRPAGGAAPAGTPVAQPALLLRQSPEQLAWRRLSDGSLLQRSRARLTGLAGSASPLPLDAHSQAVVSADGTRVALIDGRYRLRVVSLDLAEQHAVSLDREANGTAEVDYRHDAYTSARPVVWPTADTVVVLVSTYQAPRNLLRRRDMLLVDPDRGIRTRVPLTRYRALIAQGPSPNGYLLLFRDRRVKGPYLLVHVRPDGHVATVEIPYRLASLTKLSIPTDETGRAFLFGARGRVTEVDLDTLALREHRLAREVTPLWADPTRARTSSVAGKLPILAREQEGLALALLDTTTWQIGQPLLSVSYSGDADVQSAGGIALIGCGSCEDGIRALTPDGRERWHALAGEYVVSFEATPALTLALTRAVRPSIGYPETAGPTRVVVLDTATGEEVARPKPLGRLGYAQLLTAPAR